MWPARDHKDVPYARGQKLLPTLVQEQSHGQGYKKLRYREEHSASVLLSWCTL